MLRYIDFVSLATDKEVLSSITAFYGSYTAPNYSLVGVGSSTEVSYSEWHRL